MLRDVDMFTFKSEDSLLLQRYVFFIAVSIAPLQIYTVSIFGVYLSLSMLAAYVCYAFVPVFGLSSAHKVTIPLLAMFAWMVLVLPAHQEKDYLLKVMFYNMPFVSILICGYYLASSKVEWRLPFYAAIAFSSINAVLIILFRVHHPAEQYFYHLPIAKIFINPNRVDYILRATELANSYMDSRKAGGVFPNANYAAVFTGISCLASYGLYKATSSKILLIASLLLLTAVPATGSKSAYVAALVIALWMFIRERRSCCIFITTCLCVSLVISFTTGNIVKQFNAPTVVNAAKQSQKMLTYHANNTAANYGTRLQLWKHSYSLLLQRPLLGNSPNQLEEVGGVKFRVMQSHNVYLKIGVYFGIPALIFAVLFHLGMLHSLFRATQVLSSPYKDFAFCTFLSFFWMVAQGLVSNAEPVGEFHSAALLAGMSGVTLGLAFPTTQD